MDSCSSSVRLRGSMIRYMTRDVSTVNAPYAQVCWYCGTGAGPFQREHIIPRARGGPHHWKNIASSCKSCNISKSYRLPSEWCPQNERAVELEKRLIEEFRIKIRTVLESQRSGEKQSIDEDLRKKFKFTRALREGREPEIAMLIDALDRTEGRSGQAMRILGLNPCTMNDLMHSPVVAAIVRNAKRRAERKRETVVSAALARIKSLMISNS